MFLQAPSKSPGHQRLRSPKATHQVDARLNGRLLRPLSFSRLGHTGQPTRPDPQPSPFAKQREGVRGWTDAEADMLSAEASSAICVQRFDGSRNSAIHTTYRISLRSSSLREPRYPLLRVVFGLKEPARPGSTSFRGWFWVGRVFWSAVRPDLWKEEPCPPRPLDRRLLVKQGWTPTCGPQGLSPEGR